MTADLLQEAALRYARAGHPVFPCGVLKKTPNGKLAHHGVKDATARTADVESWWSRVPKSNIGWATQVRSSDPFVLDVDTKHGIDGWATVERLNGEHPNEPIPLGGPQTVTPSKPPEGSGLRPGGHVWLRAKDELPVPSKVSFAPGLDTRGAGGYVLVAPSRTEDGEYQGDPPLDPSAVPYAPPWLLDMIRDAKATSAFPETRGTPTRSPPANAEEIAKEAVRIAAEYWKPGDRRLLTHGLAVFFGRDLGLSRDRTEDLIGQIARGAGDSDPIARDKVDDAWKKVGTGQRASVRHWLDQAGLPELGVRLFALLGGPRGPETATTPWAGKDGWEEEPEIEIKTEKKTVGHGEEKQEIDVLVEPGYLVYNRLVGAHGFRPFRTLSKEPRVAVPTPAGVEVLDPAPVAESEFVAWVGYRYYTLAGDRVPTRDLQVAARALAGRAKMPELPASRVVDLSIRVASLGRHESLLDLGDLERRCVRLGPDGWSVERVGLPVFERPSHMIALPEPERAPGEDGDWTRVKGLFRFVSVGLGETGDPPDERERATRARREEGLRYLVLAEPVHFLLSPRSPKVISVLGGDEGSGKSWATKKLGAVVDPSLVPYVGTPENEQDLLALALNRATLCIDNVSRIDLWLSDSLARLSTGTGLAKRKLYTDRDEVVSRLIPRIILNGITASPRFADLIRRCLFLTAVKPERSLGEAEFEAAWAEAHPRILGGLLDLCCRTARVLRDAPPEGNGDSMADFVRIGRAVAVATGAKAEVFDSAWAENQSRQLAAAEENPWVGALFEVFDQLRKDGGTLKPEEIARRISADHRESFPGGVSSQEVGNAVFRFRKTILALGLSIGRRKGTAGVRLYFVETPERGATGATQTRLSSEKDSGTPSGTSVAPPLPGATERVAPSNEVPLGSHPPDWPDAPSENGPGVAPVAPPLKVSGADTGSAAEGASPGADPEDLFAGRPTRADRARAHESRDGGEGGT